jgi:hypothetical protein
MSRVSFDSRSGAASRACRALPHTDSTTTHQPSQVCTVHISRQTPVATPDIVPTLDSAAAGRRSGSNEKEYAMRSVEPAQSVRMSGLKLVAEGTIGKKIAVLEGRKAEQPPHIS